MYIYTITSLKKHDIGYGLNRLVYVGSCKDYVERFSQHKRDCFNQTRETYNFKVYKIIREIGWDNFVCEVIEVMSDDTTDEELFKMEQHYIDKFESKKSLNTNDAPTGMSKLEYNKKRYAENADAINKQRQDFRNKNREYVRQTERLWMLNNPEKVLMKREKQKYKKRMKTLMRQTFKQFCNITIYED